MSILQGTGMLAPERALAFFSLVRVAVTSRLMPAFAGGVIFEAGEVVGLAGRLPRLKESFVMTLLYGEGVPILGVGT